MKRKAISKKKRFEIFKRDGFKCQYCGNSPPDVILHVDHIVAVANGGDNEECNLTTSCQPCNLGKHATPLDSIPESLKKTAQQVKESEAQLIAYRQAIHSKTIREEDDMWFIAEILTEEFGMDRISKKYLTSIKTFLQRLDIDEVEHAMIVATERIRGQQACFRYFCGICWAMIRENKEQEDAKS